MAKIEAVKRQRKCAANDDVKVWGDDSIGKCGALWCCSSGSVMTSTNDSDKLILKPLWSIIILPGRVLVTCRGTFFNAFIRCFSWNCSTVSKRLPIMMVRPSGLSTYRLSTRRKFVDIHCRWYPRLSG